MAHHHAFKCVRWGNSVAEQLAQFGCGSLAEGDQGALCVVQSQTVTIAREGDHFGHMLQIHKVAAMGAEEPPS